MLFFFSFFYKEYTVVCCYYVFQDIGEISNMYINNNASTVSCTYYWGIPVTEILCITV